MFKNAIHKFRACDKFTAGRPQLKVDFDGTGPAYKSYMGAVVSILYTLLSATYLYLKIVTLSNGNHVDITNTIAESVIDSTFKFTNADSDLFIAAAITAFDNEKEMPEDMHRYGRLLFEHDRWG